MKPASNNWSTTDNAKGVLLFAQLFRDVISPETFESFRSYTLDTPARLKETLFLAREISKGNINRPTAEPAFSEVIWSIKKDIAATDETKELIPVLDSAYRSNSISDLIHALNLAHREAADGYGDRIEKIILDCFDDPKARIKLRQAVSLYCSHLLNLGYSRKYLQKKIEETFFTADIQRTGRQSLASFFRHFSGERRKYKIFTHVNESFGKHLKQLGYNIESRSTKLDQLYQNYIITQGIITTGRHFILQEVLATDENNAVLHVHRILSSIKAIAYIVRPDFECEWEANMLVHPSRSNRWALISEAEVTIQRYVPAVSSSRTIKSARGFTRKILTTFDRASLERIASSINTAALAHSSSSAENQIISLWSSIEVLLSSPLQGEARIIHYMKNIKPLICLRHPRRKTVYVYDQLAEYYGRKFHKIVNEENLVNDVDQHTKFAGILYLKDNEALRTKLLALCAENPLALHRMFMLHRDYSSTKKFLTLSNDHAQRVEWQIHRIYRARNQLVHNGKMPRYIESLIINMDEYFRYAIGTIINKSAKTGGRNSIDQMVFDISAEYSSRMRKLEKTVSSQEKMRIPESDKFCFSPEDLKIFFR